MQFQELALFLLKGGVRLLTIAITIGIRLLLEVRCRYVLKEWSFLLQTTEAEILTGIPRLELVMLVIIVWQRARRVNAVHPWKQVYRLVACQYLCALTSHTRIKLRLEWFLRLLEHVLLLPLVLFLVVILSKHFIWLESLSNIFLLRILSDYILI